MTPNTTSNTLIEPTALIRATLSIPSIAVDRSFISYAIIARAPINARIAKVLPEAFDAKAPTAATTTNTAPIAIYTSLLSSIIFTETVDSDNF